MAAVKQWNPHDSSSAVTLSTTVADSTDTEWLREIMVYNIIIQDGQVQGRVNVLKNLGKSSG